MRVTTQMLNNAASKAGITLTGGSLLDYVNNGSSYMGNNLLNSLGKSNTIVDSSKKAAYEKQEKAADQLSQNAGVFAVEKNSVFDKAKESGDKQGIYDAAEALADSYNDMLDALQSSPSSLEIYYGQLMKEAAAENKEALEKIGITLSKDGKMVLDKDKLKAADMDSLEKALGNSTAFTTKLAFLGSRISSNAAANASSLSNQYNSFGNIYSSLMNKYDFWG